MLLIAQCNELHAAMPFLFERINDETELLLPENLLHSDSLIRKLVEEVPEEDWTLEHRESPRGNGETVLVIDDEPMIIDIGRAMLCKLGYKVITAGEVELGLEYFNDRKDEIDIVILDVVMPGANGRDILREIRRVKPLVPVILSSGYDRSVIEEDFSADGNLFFMQKPYSLDDLGRHVHRSLHGA